LLRVDALGDLAWRVLCSLDATTLRLTLLLLHACALFFASCALCFECWCDALDEFA
jgi:hypothetical protein